MDYKEFLVVLEYGSLTEKEEQDPQNVPKRLREFRRIPRRFLDNFLFPGFASEHFLPKTKTQIYTTEQKQNKTNILA